MKATYLLIKSSVLSVTDAIKPIHVFSDAQFENDSPMFQSAMNTFYKTFIKVDNDVLIWELKDKNGEYYALCDDGLYPAPEGIEFETKWHNPCVGAKKCLIADDQNRNNCAQLHGNVCQKLHQVSVLTPLKQEPICPTCGKNYKSSDPVFCSNSFHLGEPGNEAKKESGMDKLTIYRFQAKQIEDTFRLVQRIFECHKKESSVDRDVMVSWQMIKNVLSGKIDEHVNRL